jgi:hypothetical protein
VVIHHHVTGVRAFLVFEDENGATGDWARWTERLLDSGLEEMGPAWRLAVTEARWAGGVSQNLLNALGG